MSSGGEDLAVSVVVPVFNGGQFLAPCLESLLGQDLGDVDSAAAFEIVAVDDGSTDGSGTLLDSYAVRDPRLRVIHQSNSGWPGRPRNVGLAASRGRYVFFADADDYLAPHALRRMVAFADEHGSDIVVPKVVGVGGYFHTAVPWRRTQIDADLVAALHALGPTKLFRRGFLDERGLRFREGVVRLEDGIFVAEAYLTARRVSLLADADYYFARQRPGGGHISSRPPDPETFLDSVAAIIEIIREHCRPPRYDAALADDLALLVYRRKGLKWFGPERYELMAEPDRRAWLAAVRRVANRDIDPALDDRLPWPQRVRGRLVRRGDDPGLLAFARAQATSPGGEPPLRWEAGRVLLDSPLSAAEPVLDVTADVEPRAVVGDVQRTQAGHRLLLRVGVRGARLALGGTDPAYELVLRRRGTADVRVVPLQATVGAEQGETLLAAELGREQYAGPAPARWDVSVRLRAGGDPARESRVRGGPTGEPGAALLTGNAAWEREGRRAWPYVTTYGNLSLRLEPLSPSAPPPAPAPGTLVAEERSAVSQAQREPATSTRPAIGRSGVSRPRVSVVIPVYNTGPYLVPCLDSLLGQDIGRDAGRELMEVVAVDDGSTDGSGQVLDSYAAAHAHVRVIHQENSGWPGRPRNVGVAASTGDYVFFVDADDEVAPEALRRLVAFADEHGSDIVVPKMVGVGGRRMSDTPWRRTQVDADLTLAFLTLTPLKLFRRSFLDAHDIRFPEGKVRLEDGILLAQAYLVASRVSMLGGYDFYRQRQRETGGNISARRTTPDEYLSSVTTIIDRIYTYGPPRHDADLVDTLALLIYRRKALKWVGPNRYERMLEPRRRAWLAGVREIAQSRIAEPLDDRLPWPQRLRSRLVRRGDAAGLLALARAQAAGEPTVRWSRGRVLLPMTATRWPHQRRDELDITADVEPRGVLDGVERLDAGIRLVLRAGLRGLRLADRPRDIPLDLLLRSRDGSVSREVATRLVDLVGDGELLLHADLGADAVNVPEPAIWDVFLRLRLPGPRASASAAAPQPALPGWREQRLRRGEAVADEELAADAWGTGEQRRLQSYFTKHGNLSVRVEGSAELAGPAGPAAPPGHPDTQTVPHG